MLPQVCKSLQTFCRESFRPTIFLPNHIRNDARIEALIKLFPKIYSLTVGCAKSILTDPTHLIDAGIKKLAENCKQLSSLNLNWCRNVTDVVIKELAGNIKQLSSLNLDLCKTCARA